MSALPSEADIRASLRHVCFDYATREEDSFECNQSQSSLNATAATKAAKTAYDDVKIAIAAAGPLAPFSRQTMYAAPAIWSSMKVPMIQRASWLASC
jgi:hypothetical protein